MQLAHLITQLAEHSSTIAGTAARNSRVGKGISAQAPHRTVLETLTSHGSSHSVIEKSTTLSN
ncbi:MAG: hypothetical protein JWQ09_1679 [Segetibacter sp.]|nr:hypothetical protein [Segetibacter sp.]